MDNDIQLFGLRINWRILFRYAMNDKYYEEKRIVKLKNERKKFLFPRFFISAENCEMYIRGIVTHAIGHSLSI